MLVTLREILQIAENRKIAVGAFNAANLESLQANVAAAEELKVPMILQFAQCHEEWIPLKLIGPLMVDFAKKASVPICVHLDHGETLDYLQQARDFVEQTGIDALACSFGTTHGIYLKQPKLDFDVVRRVRELTGNIPVVMHGGSGVSSEDFHRAIEAGVRKINYFTYMDKAGGNATAQYLGSLKEGEPIFFSSVIEAAREGMKENVKAAMKVFAKME